MSQKQRDESPAGERNRDAREGPEANDRREFIRQSLGVAPLMFTLGNRSQGGGTSLHGTLWASLGTKWKHEGDWWRFKRDRWRWTKDSGDSWRGQEEPAPRDWRREDEGPVVSDNETEPAPKEWDWGSSEARRRRELEAESKRTDQETRWRQHSEIPTTKPSYDWREDDAWKRSEGLSHLPPRSTGKKD